jgi:hypothetical protein
MLGLGFVVMLVLLIGTVIDIGGVRVVVVGGVVKRVGIEKL